MSLGALVCPSVSCMCETLGESWWNILQKTPGPHLPCMYSGYKDQGKHPTICATRKYFPQQRNAQTRPPTRHQCCKKKIPQRNACYWEGMRDQSEYPWPRVCGALEALQLEGVHLSGLPTQSSSDQLGRPEGDVVFVCTECSSTEQAFKNNAL